MCCTSRQEAFLGPDRALKIVKQTIRLLRWNAGQPRGITPRPIERSSVWIPPSSARDWMHESGDRCEDKKPDFNLPERYFKEQDRVCGWLVIIPFQPVSELGAAPGTSTKFS